MRSCSGSWWWRFNPRPRVGANPRALVHDTLWAYVSIHAPVWGRTLREAIMVLKGRRFNPRPRVGANLGRGISAGKLMAVSIHAPVWGRTSSTTNIYTVEYEFQSTPPCGGERGGCLTGAVVAVRFNPRPRVGANVAASAGVSKGSRVSIHAPVWGRT